MVNSSRECAKERPKVMCDQYCSTETWYWSSEASMSEESHRGEAGFSKALTEPEPDEPAAPDDGIGAADAGVCGPPLVCASRFCTMLLIAVTALVDEFVLASPVMTLDGG